MNFAAWLLKTSGWRLNIAVPDTPKCLICVAPHTSNWDFVLGKLAYWAIDRHAGFLMKSQWFFWPLGCLLRAMGGIPVKRGKKGTPSVTRTVVDLFKRSKRLQIAITPEGTRSANNKWHTGFLHIAREAKVPIQLAIIDYGTKEITLARIFKPTGNIEADMDAIKAFYRLNAPPSAAKYPKKFITD